MDIPRNSRVRKSVKVLLTLAITLVVLMLATLAIVNGFLADDFQRISQEIRLLVQTKSMVAGSRYKEIDEKQTSSLAGKELIPQETVSLGRTGELNLSPPQSAPPAQVPSASKLVVQSGESLTEIIDRKYPENQQLGMEAVILANPEIAIEDIIHPGQVLYLPEVNFANQTIRLEDNLHYAIYGTYLSATSLKEDSTWLEKKKVHFVVRQTKGSMRNVIHRVFLGGYETQEELQEALRDVKTGIR